MYINIPTCARFVIDAFVVMLFFQIIAFDELKTDYKNPIDQCNTLNPVSNGTLLQPSLPLTACSYALLICFRAIVSVCIFF